MTQSAADRQWYIVERWQEYDAEIRVNLVRLLAIFSLYAIHLYNFYFMNGAGKEFHRTVTLVGIAWATLALASLLAVRRRFLPWWLKYVTTGMDVLLLTVLLVSGIGPQSPMIVAYFLILALAAMRLQLPLIRSTTAAVVLSYVFVLGVCHPLWFGDTSRDFRVPRHEELIVVVSLLVTGLILGQIARRVRSLAVEFVDRLQQQDERP